MSDFLSGLKFFINKSNAEFKLGGGGSSLTKDSAGKIDRTQQAPATEVIPNFELELRLGQRDPLHPYDNYYSIMANDGDALVDDPTDGIVEIMNNFRLNYSGFYQTDVNNRFDLGTGFNFRFNVPNKEKTEIMYFDAFVDYALDHNKYDTPYKFPYFNGTSNQLAGGIGIGSFFDTTNDSIGLRFYTAFEQTWFKYDQETFASPFGKGTRQIVRLGLNGNSNFSEIHNWAPDLILRASLIPPEGGQMEMPDYVENAGIDGSYFAYLNHGAKPTWDGDITIDFSKAEIESHNYTMPFFLSIGGFQYLQAYQAPSNNFHFSLGIKPKYAGEAVGSYRYQTNTSLFDGGTISGGGLEYTFDKSWFYGANAISVHFWVDTFKHEGSEQKIGGAGAQVDLAKF